MLIDPHSLENDLERLEEIEKASLRLVVQAMLDFRQTAAEIFAMESDLVADIGEDITREAIDRMGVSKIDQRLFGKMDYKRACYLFLSDFAIKQALFVDSKAEKISGRGTATLQTSQFSLVINQMRGGRLLNVPGKLPKVLSVGGQHFLTTTLFVKYNYAEAENKKLLKDVTIAALPNGMLQEKYNPDERDTIFLAGRNSEQRGEEFRVRLSFSKLKSKASWRVQKIPLYPTPFEWQE